MPIMSKQAAEKIQRVTMELSGHAPFIVHEDANIEKATDMAMAAKYRNNGYYRRLSDEFQYYFGESTITDRQHDPGWDAYKCACAHCTVLRCTSGFCYVVQVGEGVYRSSIAQSCEYPSLNLCCRFILLFFF